MRDPAIPTSPRWRRMGRQRAALCRARHRRSRDRARRGPRPGARHRPCPRLAGGPRPGAAALWTARSRPRTVMTGAQPRRSRGCSRTNCSPTIGLPPQAFAIDGVEYSRHDRLPQGRARLCRLHHHGVADVRRGNPDAGGRVGLDGLLRQRAAVLTGILNGIDDAVWDPATDVTSPRTSTRSTSPGARRTRRRCRPASASRPSRRPFVSGS